jgi:hypothetical protein
MAQKKESEDGKYEVGVPRNPPQLPDVARATPLSGVTLSSVAW